MPFSTIFFFFQKSSSTELINGKYKLFVGFMSFSIRLMSYDLSVEPVAAYGSFTHLHSALFLFFFFFTGLLTCSLQPLWACQRQLVLAQPLSLTFTSCSPRFNCSSIKPVSLLATHTRKTTTKRKRKKRQGQTHLAQWFSSLASPPPQLFLFVCLYLVNP